MDREEALLDVSIVITSNGQTDRLERCLWALSRQTIDPLRIEIFVVEYGICLETARFLSQITQTIATPLFHIQYCQAGSAAQARNEGWQRACADVVAFLDEGSEPDPDWLRTGLEAMQDPHCIGVWGAVTRKGTYDIAEIYAGDTATINCFCRREFLRAIEGFDERFDAAWQQNSDLYFTLLEFQQAFFPQHRLLIQPRVRVKSLPEPASWKRRWTSIQKSMFEALLYKKHPKLYRQSSADPTPWLYFYLSSLCAILGLWGWQARYLLVTATALLGWAVCTFEIHHVYRHIRDASSDWIGETLWLGLLLPLLAVFWRLWGAVRFRVWFI